MQVLRRGVAAINHFAAGPQCLWHSLNQLRPTHTPMRHLVRDRETLNHHDLGGTNASSGEFRFTVPVLFRMLHGQESLCYLQVLTNGDGKTLDCPSRCKVRQPVDGF